MSVLSENGWPAVSSTKGLTRFTAGGAGFWGANADVAVCLGEFVRQFVARIEPLAGKILDDWSYANRLVRGSSSVVSNHGSATAIDLNSLQHPRGVHNTFSPAEQRIMHEIRDSITDDSGRTVLRLGMDYNSTVDDMHVEIAPGVSRAEVKQAADKIRNRQKENTVTTFDIDDSKQLDPHKLTDSDVAAIGDPDLKGKTSSWSSLIRFPPAVARLRRELGEFVRAIRGDITSARSDVAAVKAQSASNGGQLSNLTKDAAATRQLVVEIDDKVEALIRALDPPKE